MRPGERDGLAAQREALLDFAPVVVGDDRALLHAADEPLALVFLAEGAEVDRQEVARAAVDRVGVFGARCEARAEQGFVVAGEEHIAPAVASDRAVHEKLAADAARHFGRVRPRPGDLPQALERALQVSGGVAVGAEGDLALGRDALQVGQTLPDGRIEPLVVKIVVEPGVVRGIQAHQGRFGRRRRLRGGLAAHRQQQAREPGCEDAGGGGHFPPRAPRR